MNIIEVARRAKVSKTTVSRVLNHPELVHEDTRNRVLQVMEELNYSPNWFARNLNLSATNTIAVLVPTIESPFYQRMVAGIEAIANDHKYTLILCHTHNDPTIERRQLSALIDRKVDGLILTSTSLDKEELKNVILADTPHVFIGQDDERFFDSSCYISYEQAGYQMTNHLLSMNPSKPLDSFHLFLDERPLSRTKRIEHGTIKALTEASIPAKTVYCKNDMSTLLLLARNLIAKDELSRLILCSDDEMAFGIIQAIEQAGRYVPQDHAIAGLSNSIFSTISQPPLTSMDPPAKKLGMVAGRLLFDILSGEPSQQQIVLHSVMNVRRSCGNRKFIHELQEV